MFITMQNICDWADAHPAQRKFIEGERILEAGHIVKCGMNVEKSTSDIVSFTVLPIIKEHVPSH